MRYTLPFLLILLTFFSCNKQKEPPAEIETFTLKVDTRAFPDSVVTQHNNHSIFLSLSQKRAFTSLLAKDNKIDLVIYDGSLHPQGKGDVYLMSPGGGQDTSINRELMHWYTFANGSGVPFFYGMFMQWDTFYTTNIRSKSEMNGFEATDFERIQNVDDLELALERISKQALSEEIITQKLYDVRNGRLVSDLWAFEFGSAGSKRSVIARVKEFKYYPNGYVLLEVKALP